MISIALSYLLALQPATVSVDVLGAPVEAVLRDVSKQTGMYFRASDRVKGEILMIRAKDVPLRELMERIADADGAEWAARDDGYELTRSAKLRQSQEAAELAERTAMVTKELESHLQTEFGPDQEGEHKIDASSRLAWRAMQTLGASALARLESGRRVVYSDNPNAMQRRWPGNLSSIVQTYVSELIAAAKQREATIHTPPFRPPTLSRALVAVSHSPFLGYATHVYLYDAKGQLFDDAFVSFQTGEISEIEKQMDPKAPKPQGEPLELSPPAREFLNLAKGTLAQQPVTVSQEMTARILDPGKFDPLGLFVGDALASVATGHSRALVASVPDFCFLTGLFLANGPVTEDAFRHWLGQTCIIDESKNGWLVVRPRLPIDTRELRVDREKMGAFYRKAWKNGGVTLGELGAYVATQPRRYDETISLFYAFFCMPEITHMFDISGLGALRTYGLLTDSQRSRMDAGEDIPINLISPEARAELADWIYQGPSYSFGGRQPGNQYVDPTDAFPNGLTMPSSLSARTVSKDSVIPLFNGTEASTIDGAPMDATTLGFEFGRQDVGEARTKGVMSSFRLGKEINVNFKFTSPLLSLDSQLAETRFERHSKPLKLTDLPSEFQDTVSKMRTEFLKQKDLENSQRGTPPP